MEKLNKLKYVMTLEQDVSTIDKRKVLLEFLPNSAPEELL
jgi:hypothetical protein